MSPTAAELDDLLYLARVNEQEEFVNFVSELAQKYSSDPKTILEACVDPESGNTPLHFCAANGLTSLAQKILDITKSDQGSTLLNMSNSSGNTPIHWAALNGHLETMKALVNAGANIWTRNQAGNLAVYEAERVEKDDVVQYLLQTGGTEKEKDDESKPTGPEEDGETEEIRMTAGTADDDAGVTSAQEKMEGTSLN